MIEDSKQWFNTLANLLERLNAVRPGENPSPYQVMTQVKQFLVIEKRGPEKLRSDLVAILDAGFMKQSVAEIGIVCAVLSGIIKYSNLMLV